MVTKIFCDRCKNTMEERDVNDLSFNKGKIGRQCFGIKDRYELCEYCAYNIRDLLRDHIIKRKDNSSK